jgi:Superinfection immunity protein
LIASFLTAVVVCAFTGAAIALYLLPVLLAWARHVPGLAAIAVINILLGWTLAGWVVALALAMRSVTYTAPAVQLFQQLPPAPWSPGAGWPGQPGAGSPVPPPRRPQAAPPLELPPHPGQPPQPVREEVQPPWPAQPW